MKQYLDMLQHILDEGVYKDDRTGTGTYSVFGYQTRFDLSEGFPLLTTKKLHLKSIIHELLWFLSGETNIRYLKENGVSIWDDWADENGDLGRVYGSQWRSWRGADGVVVDQIANLIHQIKTNPDSRRLMVSAWNPAEIDDMALPPCHCLFQFYSREATDVERAVFLEQKLGYPGVYVGETDASWLDKADELGIPKRVLSCQLFQRSVDAYLGKPFNIASYALLTMMIAQVTNHAPGEFVHTSGDLHLYSNHVEQANLQLTREPLRLPRMRLNPEVKDIFDFKFEDFILENYEAHPHIKAKVAV